MAGSSSELKFILRVESQLAKLEKELGGVEKELDRVRRAGDKAGKGIGDSMKSAGGKIRGVGKNLTVGVSLPLVAVGAMAAKTAGDFDQSMSILQASSGASGSEIEKMSALALKMGADTVFSANDAAGAMVELAKQGLTPAQISAGALQSAMQLAAADGMELADAATVASNTMAVFKLKAEDSAMIADALAGGAAASSASVGSLSAALNQGALGAKNAGMSLNETVGVLAAFDQMGLKGSDAGTSLKTMLTRLVPATDEAADAMKKYGLDFTDAQGNIEPFADVAEQLKDKLGGLSEEQRIAALNTIFGSDAARAASVAMGLGAEGVDKYVAATKESGAAQKMADARMKGTKGAVEAMNGSIETAALTLGQTMAPYVTKAAKAIADLANKFAALDGGTKKAVLGIGAVLVVIPPLLIGIGSLVSALGTLVTFAGGAELTLAGAAASAGAFLLAIAPVAIVLGLAGVAYAAHNRESGKVRDALARATEKSRKQADAFRILEAAARSLPSALQGLKGATLDVRQAALNHKQAQERVNQLLRDGKKKTDDYKQAQIDLERSKIELKNARDALKKTETNADRAAEAVSKVNYHVQGLQKLAANPIKIAVRSTVSGGGSTPVPGHATGGSFPANRPTIIGVGDQRHGSEHVLRDDQIVSIVKRAMNGDGGSGVVVNVDARGASAADATRIGSETGGAVKKAVNAKNVHLRLMTASS